MWFSKFIPKRFLSKSRLKKAIKDNPEPSPYTPNRKLCLNLLAVLDVESFKDYNPMLGKTITITVRHPNIEEYTQKIAQAIIIIKTNKSLPNTWDVVDNYTMSLDSFLVHKDGCYANPPEVIAAFKEKCTELCNIMENSDGVFIGIPAYNLRILTRTFINIEHVVKELINSSNK